MIYAYIQKQLIKRQWKQMNKIYTWRQIRYITLQVVYYEIFPCNKKLIASHIKDFQHFVWFALWFVTSKTDDDILTEPDVKKKSPHHAQPVSSTSEGKFDIYVHTNSCHNIQSIL